jgi:UDP-2,3-diacylglucosamine hydrolase
LKSNSYNGTELHLSAGKKIYFASDFHLGSPDKTSSLERERKIIRWLDTLAPHAAHLFLVGDIFDFWFEYRKAIPRGFIRFQGKLAELRDAGIPVSFFTGNHDMWMFDYFEQELGIVIYRKPHAFTIAGQRFLIGHGDGLGPGDRSYEMLKFFFSSSFCQWLFARLHPNLGIGMAHLWSRGTRKHKLLYEDNSFQGEAGEWIWQYCQELETRQHHDYYVFGHRHLPLDLPVGTASRYVNLGEWFTQYTYACFDGKQLSLQAFNA